MRTSGPLIRRAGTAAVESRLPHGLLRRVIVVAFAFAVLIVAMVVIVTFASRSSTNAEAAVAAADQAIAESTLVEQQMIDVETGLRAFIPTADPRFLAPSLRAQADLPGELATLDRGAWGDSLQDRRVDGLITAIRKYLNGYARPLMGLRGPLRGPGLDAAFLTGKLRFDALRRRFTALDAGEVALRAGRIRHADIVSRTLSRIEMGSGAVLLLGLLLVVLYTRRAIIDPVRRVTRALAGVAGGDRHALPLSGAGTELGTLTSAFNAMVRDLQVSEDALREAEEELRRAFEGTPLGMALVSLDGRWLRVNRSFCEIVGYSEAELLGLSFQKLTHPDDMRSDLELKGRVLRGEVASGQMQKRYLHRDGHVVWANLSVSLARDAAGNPLHLISQIEDITAQRAMEEALRASEARYESIAANVPGMVYRFALDLDGVASVPFASQGTQEVLGFSAQELMADPARAITSIHPDDVEAWTASVTRSAETLERWEWHGRHVDADGSIRYLHGTAQPRQEADGLVVWDGVILDETAMRVAQGEAQRAEERFRGAFEHAPIGIALVSAQGRIEEANAALGAITGRSRSDLTGVFLGLLIHPSDRERLDSALERLVLGEDETVALELRFMRAAGALVDVSLHATALPPDAPEAAPRLLCQFQDVTERKRFESQLQFMADHDPLTGLLNRRKFELELDRRLAHVKRYGNEGALLVLDLDHFKQINDTLGHNAGDELIISIASTLRGRLRESDTLARLGGDEFAFLLPKADAAEAERVAQAVIDAIRARVTLLDGAHKQITASVGITMLTAGPESSGDGALVEADLAMYDAKEAGRDTYAFYATSEHGISRTRARLAWVDRIDHALANDRFILAAQPILDLRTGEIRQYELLIRMLDDRDDLIPPATFLYIAERFGLMSRIDEWVITQAIDLLEHHHGLQLEVNISGRSLGDERLLGVIEYRLARSGVNPSRLILEVTETAAVANVTQAQQFARRLRDLGCRFALDDFGAGFGSFYYLKHLPFDYVKIDGEFVRHVTSGQTDRLVIEAVVRIAQGLGKETIAEFVTDAKIQHLVARLGVDYAQGYHIGKPQTINPREPEAAFRVGPAPSAGGSSLTPRI